jgi:hypothetical protein
MKSLSKLKDIRPWDVLKASRKDYEASAPWKKAKMKRAAFEELLLGMPEGFLDQVLIEADTERLSLRCSRLKEKTSRRHA